MPRKQLLLQYEVLIKYYTCDIYDMSWYILGGSNYRKGLCCIYLGSLNNFKTISHRVRTLSTEQLHKSMKWEGGSTNHEHFISHSKCWKSSISKKKQIHFKKYFYKFDFMHVHQGMKLIKEKTENSLYKSLRSQIIQLMPWDERM